MLLTPAEIKPKSFESRQNSFFFTRGGCVSCLRECLGARLLPQSYQYPNLSEGDDRVGGQLRGDKECPFSGVTKSGRVWRKVPESDARSVGQSVSRSVNAFTGHCGVSICSTALIVYAALRCQYMQHCGVSICSTAVIVYAALRCQYMQHCGVSICSTAVSVYAALR